MTMTVCVARAAVVVVVGGWVVVVGGWVMVVVVVGASVVVVAMLVVEATVVVVVVRGVPGEGAEDHLLVTSYWCAARQIAGLVDFLVGSPAAVSADSADYRVTRG